MTTTDITEYKTINTSPSEAIKDTVIEVNLEDETTGVPAEPIEEIKTEEVKPVEVKAQEKPEYKSRAQERIKQLNNRAKAAEEALEKERQEKSILIKQLADGNKAVKTDLKASLEANIASLTKQMAQAMQNGESELVVALQDQMIDAKMELKGISYELKDDSFKEVKQPESVKTNIPDAALAWIDTYPQFKTDPYFHNSTITENNQLLSEGFDPKSDEFYEELNERLQGRFPKIFGVQEETSVSLKSKAVSSAAESDALEDVKPASQAKVRTTEQTVSGSSRPSANAAPSKKTTSVTLTPDHIRQAERWGLSLEQMARRIAHSESNKRTDGYVPINMNN